MYYFKTIVMKIRFVLCFYLMRDIFCIFSAVSESIFVKRDRSWQEVKEMHAIIFY